ncbi:ATP-binding protein [Aestuariibius insulae]|uniref:ATP-binding protein n=1 Tax=Aestuariibius insulae TaxID=2058287 RepID=UPI00345EB9FF
MDTLMGFAEAIPLPVVIIGDDERIVVANDPAMKLLGSVEIGRHYITALRQPALLDAIEQTFKDRKPTASRYLGGEAGRDTTWAVSVAPTSAKDRLSIVLTFEDVTAMETAGQMRRDFVANVSHELRTPLTALLGFIETLGGAAKDDPQAQRKFLGIMEKEASRMSRLVEDLLSLSRVEQDERLRPTETVDLCSVVRSSAAALEPVARARDSTINMLLPDEQMMIPGDTDQLRQVFTNLIENAVKYGKDCGHVTVRLSVSDEESVLLGPGVRVDVIDDGEGIPSFHIPRLTERFYRADSHRSRALGGTGLGLAIVKHIVNRHRGRLRIKSEKGKGSQFSIILPVTP